MKICSGSQSKAWWLDHGVEILYKGGGESAVRSYQIKSTRLE